MFRTLLLSLALVAAPAFAAAPEAEDLYTMAVLGDITVGVDGRVVDVTLEDRAALGGPAADGYEAIIRAWRFEPVLEDGKPVQARARMRLALEARGTDGDLRLGVRDVWFGDQIERHDLAADAPAPMLAPPRFPMSAARRELGARLVLLLQLREDGSVEQVAVRDLELLGPGRDNARKEREVAGWFVDATLAKAREWTLPGFGGGRVLVPVSFNMYRDDRWTETHVVAMELPAWAQADDAGDEIELSAGGEPESTRLRLLSPLGGPAPVGAGG